MRANRTSKMGAAEGMALAFGLLLSRIFISSIALQISELRQIFWLQLVIDGAIALSLILMMIYVFEHISGDIFSVCKQLVGKLGAWVILVAYIGLFFANSALLLRQYTEYTLLTALPKIDFQIAILWFAISVGILCYLGIESIARSSYILLPIVIIAVVVVFIMLYPFYVFYHLTPWRGNGIMKAMQAGFSAVGYDYGLLSLLFLSTWFQDTKTLKRTAAGSLGAAVVLKVCFILSYTAVFGTNVGAEKVMPFFEMVRLVYLSEFIQRIEALFIVVWVFLGIIAIAGSLYISLHLIAALFKLPDLKPIVPLGVIIITYLAMMPPSIGAVFQLDSMLINLFNAGMYVVPILLFIMTFLKKRRKKSCTSA